MLDGWVSDFLMHRQTDLLLRQVNALVETLLATPATSVRSELPVQLKLLEPGPEYADTSSQATLDGIS